VVAYRLRLRVKVLVESMSPTPHRGIRIMRTVAASTTPTQATFNNNIL